MTQALRPCDYCGKNIQASETRPLVVCKPCYRSFIAPLYERTTGGVPGFHRSPGVGGANGTGKRR